MIQREIEKKGIPTIGISIIKKITEKVKPPRTIYLKWPFGHPLGEPFNVLQQRAVIFEAIDALYTMKEPGEIRYIPFRWRQENYESIVIKKARPENTRSYKCVK